MEVVKILENIDFKIRYQSFAEAFADYNAPKMWNGKTLSIQFIVG
ncbi:hypothetical protein [Marinifilum sp.]